MLITESGLLAVPSRTMKEGHQKFSEPFQATPVNLLGSDNQKG